MEYYDKQRNCPNIMKTFNEKDLIVDNDVAEKINNRAYQFSIDLIFYRTKNNTITGLIIIITIKD